MFVSIKTAAWRFVRGAFRGIGIDARRYVANPPAPPACFAFSKNRLSVAPAGGGWLPSRPAPFVLVASNHGTLIVNRHDYCQLGQSDAFGVGFEILNSSCFDYDEVKLALALLSKRMETHGPGVFAIDCGANIGVHTVEWARHMYDWGRVIAIEAQERVFYSLCGNIAINNCLNARAMLAAAGSTAGQMKVPIPDYGKPGSFGSLELRKRQSTEFIGQEIDYGEDACASVDVIPIDELKLERLDLLKIDVEGMEMDVLAGAEKTINLYKPHIIIEVIKSNPDQIALYLERHGYKYFPFGGNFLAVHESDSMNAGVSLVDGVLKIDAAQGFS